MSRRGKAARCLEEDRLARVARAPLPRYDPGPDASASPRSAPELVAQPPGSVLGLEALATGGEAFVATHAARSIAKLSVAEIRSRYVAGDEPVTAQLLSRLQRDRRAGVRALHGPLRRRFERQRAEEQRLDSMLNFERVLWKSGVERIAGVDEAGVGPLAGPVVAAAVVFRPGVSLEGIDDSKKLDATQREAADAAIREAAAGLAIGRAEPEEIDEINVFQASLLAMRRAVEALPISPEHVLVDAREVPGIDCPQNRFEKGDGLNFSIAAASILAKVHRDRLMVELDARFPQYGFARHAGYATPEHQEAIRRHGPCPVHRRSYDFIAELVGELSDGYYELRERIGAARGERELRACEAELAGRRDELAEREGKKLRALLTRRWKMS